MERYCIMSVYRQEAGTFTEIYFSMRHGTILSGNIEEHRENAAAAACCAKKKGEDRLRVAPVYSMAARREEISPFPARSIPITFSWMRPRDRIRVRVRTVAGEKDTSAIPHPREMHPVPADVRGYLFPGKLVA